MQDKAQVSIRDNGPGIDAETSVALFEPLSSTKQHGLGVGLRISRSLIEAHGGQLWVEPHTPGGTFHFTLRFAA
jgi:signal transduction histidine kinase